MNGGDADMMEAEATAPPSAPPPDSEPNDVRNLLTMARQLIDQGKPSQALQPVVMAMKIQGGDEAVSQTLNRAREIYMNKIQATAAADKLASLFAECAIAEAIPLPPQHKMMNEQPMEPDPQGNSILAETGRNQVVLDAVLRWKQLRLLAVWGGSLAINAKMNTLPSGVVKREF